MGLVTSVANAVLDGIFGDQTYNAPNTLYCALSTTTPTATGTNFTEPSGNNYARVSVTNNTTNFPAASNRTKATGAAIAFPQASGSWGTVTHYGFYDASSAGNLLAWGALTTPRAVGNGNTPTFASGSLTVSEA